MNIAALHTPEKEVSAVPLFKGQTGAVTSIQLKKDGAIKEHVSKTPALLLCIKGRIVYNEEEGTDMVLQPGDYVHIQQDVKHRLRAEVDSQAILMK